MLQSHIRESGKNKARAAIPTSHPINQVDDDQARKQREENIQAESKEKIERSFCYNRQNQ